MKVGVAMMRTVELQINETLFQRVEQSARLAGVSTAEFTLQLVRRSLREWTTTELEQQEIEAYKRQPVQPGEFDGWESEQAWGEP
jgi:hypothetical protein